jgi:hypothetical protein
MRGYDALEVIFIGRNIFEMDEVVITSGMKEVDVTLGSCRHSNLGI